ncbi:PREDICTED: serpin B3-like [Rhagoletis zephyria]|uniref:serpin B3-like n=1 Tax=Rhagoletis zephyria TaxID=28612 RepID=UPI00081152B5|nr:PREDICTED: serpin B3-like [Rhagoletis zephyria]
MVMAGAKGNTFNEIKSTLGFNIDMTESQLYTSFSTLLRQLNNFTSSAKSTLRLANAIALQNEYSLLPTYLHIVKNRLIANIFSVNFKEEPEQAVEKINQWVNRKTRGKIPKIVDDLSTNTRMVLLNALYFKGTWKTPFKKDSTKENAFSYGEQNKKKVNVPMMRQRFDELNYASFYGGELVELPYKNDSFSMLLFLPRTIDADSVSSIFSHALKTPNLYTKLKTREVILTLPRFKIKSSFELKPTLQGIGIETAFEDGADFTRIAESNDDENLQLSNVLHKAVVEVNEEGAEAAAVTDAEIAFFSAGPSLPPIQMDFNRSFLFAIRCNRLQLTLFAGIVNKP